MTVDQLCQFMKEEQKYDICREEGKHLIEAFEPSADTSSLSLDGFSHFIMFSDLHLILNPITKVVYQDMTQPLSHYWIASSHNTYLLGTITVYHHRFRRFCQISSSSLNHQRR